MRPVPEPIPLTPTLRIHANLIIIARPIRQSRDLVLRRFSMRVGRLAVIQRPVYRYADTYLDFLAGRAYDVGGEEVQGAQVVLVTRCVPETPGAAMGHSRNGRDGLVGGETVRLLGWYSVDGSHAI